MAADRGLILTKRGQCQQWYVNIPALIVLLLGRPPASISAESWLRCIPSES